MIRQFEAKCYIGDYLYKVLVDRDITNNIIKYTNIDEPIKIQCINIDEKYGISYWKNSYELIVYDEDIDSYHPCSSCCDIFVFSSFNKAKKFVYDLENSNLVKKIRWW